MESNWTPHESEIHPQLLTIPLSLDSSEESTGEIEDWELGVRERGVDRLSRSWLLSSGTNELADRHAGELAYEAGAKGARRRPRTGRDGTVQDSPGALDR